MWDKRRTEWEGWKFMSQTATIMAGPSQFHVVLEIVQDIWNCTNNDTDFLTTVITGAESLDLL